MIHLINKIFPFLVLIIIHLTVLGQEETYRNVETLHATSQPTEATSQPTEATSQPILNDYLQQAAENNPGLQAKYSAFEAALQKIPQVSTLPDPTFSFGYFISPVETRVGPQQARFSLSQMFPWFGTLKAQGDAATLQAEAKYQAFIDARNALYYRVAAAYYPLYELREKIRLQRENLDILESYKTIAQKKFENGKGTMVDVLRVDILMNDVQTNINILEEKEKPLITTFNNLLNRDVAAPVEVADTLRLDTLKNGYRKDSLLHNHPKLNELDLKSEEMRAREIVAQKQGLPRFGVGLDYVVVDQRRDLTGDAALNLQDNGKNAFMPMATVSIPIFRGKYKASKKEAQLMQESFHKKKEETANNLQSAYENTWFKIEQNKQYVELYKSQITETKQALDLLFSSYSNAENDFEEVLRMQQQLLKYEMEMVSALAKYKTAVARLDYITGKSMK